MALDSKQAIEQTWDKIYGPSLNTKLSARYLDLKTQTLCNWRCQRRGPVYHKVGGRIIYRKSDLDKFLAACRIDPESRE